MHNLHITSFLINKFTTMKTSHIVFRSLTDCFVFPCFDTTLSRESIISRLLGNRILLGNRDLTSYQFQFVGPCRYDKPRSESSVYCINHLALSSAGTIEFIRVPKCDSFFVSSKL